MKRQSTTKTLLAGAAFAGMISGGFLAQATAATSTQPANGASLAGVLADATPKPDPDHGCAGKNTCKGKGGCKGGDNGCAGKNSCKGKGGCAIKDGKPVHPVTPK